MSRDQTTYAAVATMAALGALTAARAQQPAQTADETAGQLQQIVVTATRRESALEETPISISVLSSSDIEKNVVISMTDVTRLTPSLVYLPRSGSENYLSLRGATIFDDSPGTDPAVSMFVDDVVRVSVADLQPELFDMDRVEVLKGPQGTLFGRNSVGGIVSLYTKQPTFETNGSAEASYGEHNLTEVRGMFNTPLIADKVAARIVLAGYAVDGNVHDITTGGDLNREQRWAARAKLLFTPTDDFKFVTTFDYLHKYSSEPTVTLANFQPALAPGITSNPEQTAQRSPGAGSQKNWGLTGRADWTTGLGTLTSITGYRHLDARDLTWLTTAPINIANVGTEEHDNQITEELRFASAADQRLTWIAGTYFLHSNKTRPFTATIDYLPGSLISLITAFPAPIQYVAGQTVRTTSAAPFADVKYAISDELKFDLGGRYTWQKKSGDGYVNPSGGFSGGPISATFDASWTAFTPSATLTYQPTKALMTYATVSKGFQSGGFNEQGQTNLALGTPYDSEFVWNYEIGAKFNGLNNRLQINVAAFADRYTNLQVIQLDTRTQTIDTTNAGAASVDGIETDIAAAPVDWLTLGLKYDYLNSKFTKYLINNGGGSFTNYTGNKVPFTPKHRVTASAEFHSNLPNGAGGVAFGGDYTYRTSQEMDAANSIPPDVREATVWNGIVNLHASFTPVGDRWEVLLWGKNVTNRHYAFYAQDETVYYATPAEFANSPPNHIFELQEAPYRSFGVTLRWKF
jgi:iron complex outermembrane recepter protein